VDAYYAVEQEIDMLRTWLGRTALSGSGQNFPLYVGLNDVNAYWDGSSGTFGHSSDSQRQATNIDVVGHEMGHAIFQYTSGGTGSGNENGGINESTGDIFGALTEHYANNPNDPPDYTVGEEVNLTGSGPIRYMYNPSLVGDPNCYSSAIPNTEVHSAAGPNNHWFYLVAVGSAGGGGDPFPDLQQLVGDRRRHPARRPDLHERPQPQDVELAVRERAYRDPLGGGQPLRGLVAGVQVGQGGLGRGERTGAVG